MGQRLKRILRAIARPKVFVPLALTAGLLAALFSLADLGAAITIMSGFKRASLAYFLVLMIGYEVVRGVQWSYCLHELNLHVPLRKQIFAFALSEVTKALPIGNYFQNYILKLMGEADFSRSSVATTLIVFEEAFVCLVGVVLLGLGGWTTWARVAILAGFALIAALVWLYRQLPYSLGEPPPRLARHQRIRQVVDSYGRFRAGAKDILHPRPIAVTLGFSAAYLSLAGLALYIVTDGLGIPHLTVSMTMSVYFFSLALGLLIPIPVDIGVIELSGLGAFTAFGVGRNAALSAMLVNRLLSIGASLLLAFIVVALLYREMPALFQRGKRRAPQPTGRTPDQWPTHATGA